MIDIKYALSQAVAHLLKTSPSARLDAEVLLAHTLKTSKTYLHAHPEMVLTPIQWDDYQASFLKRGEGVPIAYLTGTREFWSLEFELTQDTLIPRPETELLVELTLALLADKKRATVLDLGTGSGAIALALATERPNWRIVATDINQNAVDAALNNKERFNVANVELLCSDWFESIPLQQFDAIVSNPPYISEDDPHLLQGDVRFEPRRALVSGDTGFDAIAHIIKHSSNYLVPGGLLLLEHGYEQKPRVFSLLEESGYLKTQCWQDWQGHDRVSGGWRKK